MSTKKKAVKKECKPALVSGVEGLPLSQSINDYTREALVGIGMPMLSRHVANWDDPTYRRGFIAGVKAAAALAAEYPTTHPFRLDDCIECKLNVTSRKKPRRRFPATALGRVLRAAKTKTSKDRR